MELMCIEVNQDHNQDTIGEEESVLISVVSGVGCIWNSRNIPVYQGVFISGVGKEMVPETSFRHPYNYYCSACGHSLTQTYHSHPQQSSTLSGCL